MPQIIMRRVYKAPPLLSGLTLAALLVAGCSAIKPNEQPPTDAAVSGLAEAGTADTSTPIVCGDLLTDVTELWVDGSTVQAQRGTRACPFATITGALTATRGIHLTATDDSRCGGHLRRISR
jgi:hypothetical protein